MLINEAVDVALEGESLRIIGTDDPHYYYTTCVSAVFFFDALDYTSSEMMFASSPPPLAAIDSSQKPRSRGRYMTLEIQQHVQVFLLQGGQRGRIVEIPAAGIARSAQRERDNSRWRGAPCLNHPHRTRRGVPRLLDHSFQLCAPSIPCFHSCICHSTFTSQKQHCPPSLLA